jgi:hypothetical protein
VITVNVSFTNLPAEKAFEVKLRCDEIGAGPSPSPRIEHKVLRKLKAEADHALLAIATEEKLEKAGTDLFQALFTGDNATFLARAQERAKTKEAHLRLAFELPEHHASQEARLLQLPFEILRDDDGFLAADTKASVARLIAGRVPRARLQAPNPLRILLTTASLPEKPIEHENVAASLREAYPDTERVQITTIPELTLTSLNDSISEARLAKKPFHIWHHCGHGSLHDTYGAEKFALLLRKGETNSYPSVEEVARAIGKNSGILVALLAVCHAAQPHSLAPAVARLKIPVVIAFPDRLDIAVADKFTKTFHSKLGQETLETAFCEARSSISSEPFATRDWCKVRLFCHSIGDVRLLDPPGEPHGTKSGSWTMHDEESRREAAITLARNFENLLPPEMRGRR